MTKILVIEDESLIRESIIDILMLESFQVVSADNGQDGLTAIFTEQPDLILCDIAMPGTMNGYDVLVQLRSQPEMAKVPFIFLTAKVSRPDQRKGMLLGADDYLTKPFSAQDLLAAVHTQLGKRLALQQAYGQDLDKLRESIIYAIPHEFRTPLYSISGYASILMEEHTSLSPDVILHTAERIYANAARLNRLIEKYLLFAQLQLMPHDPEQLAEIANGVTPQSDATIEVAAVYWAQELQREADLKLSLHPTAVHVQEVHLSKIVEELIENAFKFSEAGMVVHVASGEYSGSFFLRVTDRGHGMSREQIDAIGAITQFNRQFYEQRGMGLGLAICTRLVALYHGNLSINSTVGEGTTVVVTLPLAVRDVQA
jgi:signal transduction histidine kinase